MRSVFIQFEFLYLSSLLGEFVVSQVAALDKGPDRVLHPLAPTAASERRCVFVRRLVARCHVSRCMIGPPTGRNSISLKEGAKKAFVGVYNNMHIRI